MSVEFRYLLVSFLLLFITPLCAQKEASYWYFGNHAGIDFKSGTPQVVHDGQTSTIEGVASISDNRGELLFYTDGLNVWNRNHVAMPNGNGLNGHISSTQSAIIVPVIGDTNRYYIFTIDDYGSPQRLQYSVVNMTRDGNLGDIESKNNPIITGVSEKLTAVRHCNKRDIWIITHSTFSNFYYSFLVDPAGVHTAPVISQGMISLFGNSVGYLKASPDGRKIASAFWTRNSEVSDFNNVTGVVSNSLSLFQNVGDTTFSVYGVEFSPNGKLLYLSLYFNVPRVEFGDYILQYEISNSTPSAIVASRQLIAKQIRKSNFAALQLAPDGKIYVAKSDQTELAAINQPNVRGSNCDFVLTAIQFTPPNEKSYSGLPNFTQSYFFRRDSFSYGIDCPGSKFNFQSKIAFPNETCRWDFGEPSSGGNNQSTLENPTHVYVRPGQYKVQLIINTPCGSDTLYQFIQSTDLNLNLGKDTLICDGRTVELTADDGINSYQYLWQDGSRNSGFSVIKSGDYWAEIKNSSGCMLKDSIHIDFARVPRFSLGNDTFICPGKNILLAPDLDPLLDLKWQDGRTFSTMSVNQPGLYSLKASNGCGTSEDDILISPGVCKVYLPSAFTPNGDGKNDLFKILGTENLSSLHLKIFNRWGEVVFGTKDKNKGWDGKYRGVKTSTSVFIYTLEYLEIGSTKTQHMKGSFVLIN